VSPESETLRALPSVEVLVQSLAHLGARFPRRLIVDEARRAIAEARAAIRTTGQAPFALPERVERGLNALAATSLRRVINATGVVLHTNLGRAPLAAFEPVPGYSNLEYDLATGRRGRRDTHVAGLLEALLGRPGIAVNNNAAAIYLALHELAAGGEVIVSRGELIEIGDGFRLPEIMAHSGVVLREVGATNRTSVEDYREAINERTRLLLRVHPSNFRISGFTARPSLEELAGVSRAASIPLYEDLGSGCLVDLSPYGVEEPLASASLAAGVDLISFSGDKLLGGPQAGILAGKPEIVSRLRRNPMYRALRLDKLILQALAATLRSLVLEQWDELPALAMIRQTADQIGARARHIAARIPGADVVPGRSVIGGGSTPDQTLETWLIALPGDATAWERRLRLHSPPVIARVERDRAVLDLRTVPPAEEEELLAVLTELAT
jgi:L-seryl-tRNA(Ser) seleniumtransferase